MSKKILITPKSFKNFKEQTYPLLQKRGYEIVENTLGRTMTEAEIISYARQDVVGIIIGIDPLPATVLEQCRDLVAISKYGVGMENIDLLKAKELGINVKNAVGTNNLSVAELAIGFMFSMSRSLPKTVTNVKNGSWERSMGWELTGKKLGLIGGGQIGREVAKRACGLEMRVSIYDPYFSDQDFLHQYNISRVQNFNDIFAGSDIISIHVPANHDTTHMINEHTLALMKPNCILINTSRGELVDEAALYEALVNGRIAGAAQDVFSSEPPDPEDKLLKLDNFILTSHIGAFTQEAGEKMALVSTLNLLEMLG